MTAPPGKLQAVLALTEKTKCLLHFYFFIVPYNSRVKYLVIKQVFAYLLQQSLCSPFFVVIYAHFVFFHVRACSFQPIQPSQYSSPAPPLFLSDQQLEAVSYNNFPVWWCGEPQCRAPCSWRNWGSLTEAWYCVCASAQSLENFPILPPWFCRSILCPTLICFHALQLNYLGCKHFSSSLC